MEPSRPPLDIVIVGAGIVGLATSLKLLERAPDLRLAVVDKEDTLGAHQTGHNSGVVHAGLYYTPGSLKARLCRRGVNLLRDYCLGHELTYDECGKVLVALDDVEEARLGEIMRRAVANGVPGVRMVGDAA